MKKAKKAKPRRVALPALGGFLKGLRTARGWSLKTVEQGTGGVVAYTTLHRLERGQVIIPEPVDIRALAALYAVPYEDLVILLTEEFYEVGLVATTNGQRDATRILDDAARVTHEHVTRLTEQTDRINAARATLRATITAAQRELRKVPSKPLRPGITFGVADDRD